MSRSSLVANIVVAGVGGSRFNVTKVKNYGIYSVYACIVRLCIV